MNVDDYKDLFSIRKFVAKNTLKSGTVVQFTYDGEQKYAVVLNPEWEKKMHAISLRDMTPNLLQSLLKEIKEGDDPTILYDRYKNSQFTNVRPYRTYSIEKIRNLRQIYLKPKVTKE